METVSAGSAYLGHLDIFSIRVTPAYARPPYLPPSCLPSFLPPRFKSGACLSWCAVRRVARAWVIQRGAEVHRQERKTRFDERSEQGTVSFNSTIRGWKLLDNWAWDAIPRFCRVDLTLSFSRFFLFSFFGEGAGAGFFRLNTWRWRLLAPPRGWIWRNAQCTLNRALECTMVFVECSWFSNDRISFILLFGWLIRKNGNSYGKPVYVVFEPSCDS